MNENSRPEAAEQQKRRFKRRQVRRTREVDGVIIETTELVFEPEDGTQNATIDESEATPEQYQLPARFQIIRVRKR